MRFCIKGELMKNRLLLSSLVALAACWTLMPADSAQAQFGVGYVSVGSGAGCYSHHGRHHPVPYASQRLPYDVYYGRSAYRPGIAAYPPGITVTRSRYYTAPLYPYSTRGYSSYRYGYAAPYVVPRSPRVRLSLGF